MDAKTGNLLGAEALTRLYDEKEGWIYPNDFIPIAEEIWSGEAYWKRHSPVLFPFVGAVSGGRYRTDGKEYEMGQHGFARDMDFIFEGRSDGLWFRLDYSEEISCTN